MSTLGERIRKAREEKNQRQVDLGRMVGVSAAVISNWEKDVNRPDTEKLCRLCDALDVSAAYLLDYWKGENPYTDEELASLKKYRMLDVHGRQVVDLVLDAEYSRMARHEDDSLVHRDNITYISCYDLAVSAGTGEPLGETYYKSRLEIPTERVPEQAHYCLRVNGDSMEPAYHDGDIVFVQRLDGSVQEGEIGVFILNGEGYLKRLGHQELLSLNPRYAPIPIHAFDDLVCQGRVLGKV